MSITILNASKSPSFHSILKLSKSHCRCTHTNSIQLYSKSFNRWINNFNSNNCQSFTIPITKKFRPVNVSSTSFRSGTLISTNYSSDVANFSTCICSCSKSGSSASIIDLSNFPVDRIRNFCIIAHVDHGKSTLADRILEMTGAISSKASNKQVLDTLPVERQRGITVKAQTASILHTYEGQEYLLNLIDTPGHVDFSYEVSRSLAACQGAVLLVDANRGVQAQTVANFYLAFGSDVTIVPALNKVDLPNAQPDVVKEQLETAFDIPGKDVLHVSAKLGTGISELLDAVVTRVPPPTLCDPALPFRALLYDSWFHPQQGAVCLVALRDGSVRAGSQIKAASTSNTYIVKEVGIHAPVPTPVPALYAGQVGYLMATIRKVRDAAVGDTLFDAKAGKVEPLPGFRPAKPMVFAGVYPAVQKDAPSLSSAMQKLTLNDSSVTASKESSAALGQGWRVGFLGLLHLDVFLQRLEQEYEAPTVTTTPSVPYKIVLKGQKVIKQYGSEEIIVTNPLLWPDTQIIAETLEPYVIATIITPGQFNALPSLPVRSAAVYGYFGIKA